MPGPDDWQYPIPQDVSLLPPLRALFSCATKLERAAARHLESLGVTPAQFDVLAVLGDTAGMTCKEIGEQSLITQGTLHPVLDRLESRGLVRRNRNPDDQRKVDVSLTPAGQDLYERTFLTHVRFIKSYFETLSAEEQARLVELLGKLERTLP